MHLLHTHTQPRDTQTLTNPQNSDLPLPHPKVPTLRPRQWKPTANTSSGHALLSGHTASQPASPAVYLLVDMQSILLGTDVHTALLTQSHVTEGHITLQCLYNTETQPSEAHASVTGTYNRTGYMFNTHIHTHAIFLGICTPNGKTHPTSREVHTLPRYSQKH